MTETPQGRRLYDPADELLGGFSRLDGTREFYGRLSAVLEPQFRVLDLGAGRGAWYEDDHVPLHRSLRDIRSQVAEYIGADVDPVVLQNPATSRNVLICEDRVPLESASLDVVVCDYVLEHVQDPVRFVSEVSRLLKPGGLFCGRTPHALNYVTLGARLVRNSRHVSWLRRLQPGRKAADVFPTAYRLNTLRQLRRAFAGWTDYSYIYQSEPMYYLGRKWMFDLMSLFHKLAPAAASGSIFVFVRKPLEGQV